MNTSKLPKWAQKRISDLEYKVEKLELADAYNSPIRWAIPGESSDARHSIPPTARVRFLTVGGNIDISLHLKDKGIYIDANYGTIKIVPSTCNAIYLSIDKEGG